jgi:RNA polymerase sigma factor (sigma-70 family)
MMGVGWLGLVAAERCFDCEGGSCFQTYANKRIEGAIKDEYRHRSWLSRDDWKNIKLELAAPPVFVEDDRIDMTHDLDRVLVRIAVGKLEGSSRRIIERYYFEGWTYDEIGNLLGVRGARICQIAKGIIREL